MADGPIPDDTAALLARHSNTLLEIARRSIQRRIEAGAPVRLNIDQMSAELKIPAATFVTLTRNGQLRGCVGRVEAQRPLALDVSENAMAAAFADPRFTAVTATELDDLGLSISLLTPATPMTVASEADLIAQLRPKQDGLILRDNTHRGVFLPQVWDQLPEARDFVAHLKQKAGLPRDSWSASLAFLRFEVLSIKSSDYRMDRGG